MNEHDLAELAQTLFEESGDALFLFDPESEQMLDVNPMAQRLCDRTRQELLRLRVDYLFRSELKGGMQRLRQAYRKTGPFHAQGGFLLRHRQEDTWIPVNLTITRLHTEQRTFGLITARDVTEQRHVHEQLRLKEAELREVLAGVSDCVWSANIDSHGEMRMRYCSPVAERLTGQTAEKLLQGWNAWLGITHPEDQGKLSAALVRLQSGQTTRVEVEHRLVTLPGRWIRSSLQARREGIYLRLNGVVSDITEMVHQRQQLQASEARNRSLLENLEQSVFLKDVDLRFIAVNRRFCEGIRLSEAEILGKSDFDLYPEELATKYRADDQSVLHHGQRLETEEQTLINNRLRWVRVIKTPVRDENDRLVGVLGIFWDVTEQRLLEEQLRQASRLEAVGQLAGGVAHDFNNLLTAIVGNLSLIRLQLDASMQSTVGPLLDGAEQAAWRAATLTRQLLGFSRRTVLHVEAMNVNHTLEEVRGLLQPTIDPRIELQIEPEPTLWPVVADPGQLCQVLLNLAINARDAVLDRLESHRQTHPEHVWIRLQTSNVVLTEEEVAQQPHGRPGEFVRVRVSDNGVGIPAEVLPHIFEPFFTTKGPDRGTGLGLSMVFGIVQQHQGWISCQSEPGIGTTFDVYLPRGQHEEDIATTSSAPVAVRGQGTILMVDDEPMLLNIARAVLQQAGYTVRLAADGEKAVEVYREEHQSIDLVVLDRTMPRLSGQEALRQMRQITPAVPVLIASGYSSEQLSDEEREIVLDFLAKPYSPADLLAAVRAALETAKLRK